MDLISFNIQQIDHLSFRVSEGVLRTILEVPSLSRYNNQKALAKFLKKKLGCDSARIYNLGVDSIPAYRRGATVRFKDPQAAVLFKLMHG